jgi:hypothetical protein
VQSDSWWVLGFDAKIWSVFFLIVFWVDDASKTKSVLVLIKKSSHFAVVACFYTSIYVQASDSLARMTHRLHVGRRQAHSHYDSKIFRDQMFDSQSCKTRRSSVVMHLYRQF